MLYPIEALSRATLLAGVKGATVTAVDADGVEMVSCGFLAGIHRLSAFSPFCSGADAFSVTGGSVVEQGGRGVAIRSAKHRDTGANPSYVPRSQFDPSLQAERVMRSLNKKAAALERRFAAFDSMKEKESGRAEVKEPDGEQVEPEEPKGERVEPNAKGEPVEPKKAVSE